MLIYGDWAEEQLIIGHGFPTYKLKRDPLFEYPKDGALCDMKMWWEIPVTIEMATKSFHGNKRRTRKKDKIISANIHDINYINKGDGMEVIIEDGIIVTP